ncbi:MAG: RNA polymerase factor sigma-54 [Bdellovibrionales bacterium]|nr:RNA polymerase factor sigma-54 [Bdellovibrionales bacterium]
MSAQLKMGMKLAQKLQMTPQLQQSIKLLTLPLMELEQAIRDELLENPVLEEVHDIMEDQTMDELSNQEELPERHTWMEFTSTHSVRGPRPSQVKSGSGMFNLENVVSTEKSLYDHLIWQIQMSGFSNQEKAYLNLLVDRLDENGYLKISLDQIANEMGVPLPHLQAALKLLHTLDPNGVGARDLKECLLIQACQNQEDTKDLVHLIEHHLSDLENKNFKVIAKKMNLEEEEIMDMYKIINAMEPKPGRRFVTQPVHYIIPDVYITKEGDEYRVSVNEEGLPHLRVTHVYQEMLRGLDKGKTIPLDSTQRYLRHKMNSALWLIRSINQRQRTIFKVTSAVVKHQKDFFDKGSIGMKPLILKQIAAEVGVHESTVSRVTTNKYAHTPHGVYELKYFFNSGIETDTGEKISGEVVKLKILSYVKDEDKHNPISDNDIMDRLGEDLGVHLARRTIAKYREAINILPPGRRKDQ